MAIENEVSKLLGLSSEEVRVFKSVLALGQLSVGEISLYAGLTWEKAENLAESLTEQGTLKKVEGKVNRYIVGVPFKAFMDFLSSFQDELSIAYEQMAGQIDKKVEAIQQAASAAQEALAKTGLQSIDQIIKVKEEAQTSVSDVLTNGSEDLGIALEETKDVMVSMLQGHLEEYKTIAGETKDDLSAKTEDSVAQIKEAETTAKEGVEAFQNSVITKLDEQGIKAFEEMAKNIGLKLDETLASFLEKQKEHLEQIKNGIAISLDTHVNGIETSANELTSSHETVLDSTSDSLIKTYTETLTGLEEVLNTQISDCDLKATNTKNALSQAITPALETTLKSFEDAKNAFEQKIEEIITKSADEINAFSSNLKTIASEKLTQLQTKNEELRKQIEAEVSALLGESIGKEEILTNGGDGEEELEKSEEKREEISRVEKPVGLKPVTKPSVLASMDTFKAEASNVLTTFLKEQKKRIDALNSELGTLLDQSKQTVKSILETYKQTYSNLLNDTLNEHKSSLEKLINEIGQKCSDHIESGNNALNSARKSLQTSVLNSNEQLKSKVGEAITDSNTAIDETMTQLKQAVTNFKDAADQEKTANISKIEGEISRLKEEAASKMGEQTAKIKEGIEQTKTEIEEKTSVTIQMQEETVETFKQEKNMKIEETVNTNTETIDALKLELTDLVNQHLTSTEQLANLLTTGITGNKDAILETLNVHEATYTEIVTTKTTEVSEKIQEETGKAQTVIQGTSTKVKETLDTNTETVQKTVQKLQTSLQGTVEKQMEEGLAATGGVKEKVHELITKGANKAKETNDAMMKLWKGARSFKAKETEQTWLIVGRESVINFIKSMFGRVKSTITIVTPTVEDMPIEALSEIATTKRVHLVTDADADIHSDWLRNVFSMPNVRVRQFKEQNYFAVARDGEEVLIAPQEDSPNIVAVASEQDGYVELYQKIIGPIFMSQSVEIRREHLGY